MGITHYCDVFITQVFYYYSEKERKLYLIDEQNNIAALYRLLTTIFVRGS